MEGDEIIMVILRTRVLSVIDTCRANLEDSRTPAAERSLNASTSRSSYGHLSRAALRLVTARRYADAGYRTFPNDRTWPTCVFPDQCMASSGPLAMKTSPDETPAGPVFESRQGRLVRRNLGGHSYS